MMKAWRIHSFDGTYGMKMDEVPVPHIDDNEVLVKVSAVSLNYRDKSIMEGTYGIKFDKGLIPVSDTCGIIEKVGNNVKKFKVGDRVVNQFLSHWIEGNAKGNEEEFGYGGPLNGGLAKYMVLNENSCLIPPKQYTDEECSTLPIAALTAWYSLMNVGNSKLKSGDTVLIQGIGGVSLFALQIAHGIGAKTIVLTSNEEKKDRLLKMGATFVINYKTNNEWEKEVMKITNNEGVNHVLDVVGGEYIGKSILCCQPHANIYMIGFLKDPMIKFNVFDALFKRINLHGIAVAPKDSFQEMINQFSSNLIFKPIIDTIYNFDDSIKAFQHLSRGSFGKIVIKLN
ncbi:hypothetical protein ACTA71_009522 [Dictyostelium dimigraforme]